MHRRVTMGIALAIMVTAFVAVFAEHRLAAQPGPPKLRAGSLTGAWVVTCTPAAFNGCNSKGATNIWNVVASGDGKVTAEVQGDSQFRKLDGVFDMEAGKVNFGGRSGMLPGYCSDIFARSDLEFRPTVTRGEMIGARIYATVINNTACASQFSCKMVKQ
jgi:hypothetical protein